MDTQASRAARKAFQDLGDVRRNSEGKTLETNYGASNIIVGDPLSPVMNTDLGEILLFARRYDEAAGALERALELEPKPHQCPL